MTTGFAATVGAVARAAAVAGAAARVAAADAGASGAVLPSVAVLMPPAPPAPVPVTPTPGPPWSSLLRHVDRADRRFPCGWDRSTGCLCCRSPLPPAAGPVALNPLVASPACGAVLFALSVGTPPLPPVPPCAGRVSDGFSAGPPCPGLAPWPPRPLAAVGRAGDGAGEAAATAETVEPCVRIAAALTAVPPVDEHRPKAQPLSRPGRLRNRGRLRRRAAERGTRPSAPPPTLPEPPNRSLAPSFPPTLPSAIPRARTRRRGRRRRRADHRNRRCRHHQRWTRSSMV